MKKILSLLFLLFSGIYSVAQSTVSFESDKKKIDRNAAEDKTFKFLLTAKNYTVKDLAGLTVQVSVNRPKTTLDSNSFSVDFRETTFNSLRENNAVYLTLKKDSITDRERKIILDLKVKNKEGKVVDSVMGPNKQMEITISEIIKKDSLNDFSYLAYIGTNFDLVDGIKAKNLFFASNILLKPKDKPGRMGFYLSLFGNRTMTTSDSLSNVKRTYKISGGQDGNTIYTHREQADLLITKVSDNLGAYMSPIVNIGTVSRSQNNVQLYYSPSLEFVWRRTRSTNVYSNGRNRDSVLVSGTNNGLIEFGPKSVQYANEFNFNAGVLGLFIAHENKQISVRVHLSTGYSRQYFPERNSNISSENNIGYLKNEDIFFTGRAWITEATSGITLQAEITNTRKIPKPYYGVTLSKALNFKNLGTFFSPITSR